MMNNFRNFRRKFVENIKLFTFKRMSNMYKYTTYCIFIYSILGKIIIPVKRIEIFFRTMIMIHAMNPCTDSENNQLIMNNLQKFLEIIIFFWFQNF